MEPFILPISFRPESCESIAPSQSHAGVPGNFEKVLESRSLPPRDHVGEATGDSAPRGERKVAGGPGSRNVRHQRGKNEAPSNPLPAHQTGPMDEMSPGTLEMAELLSGGGEGALIQDGEAALVEGLDLLQRGMLPAERNREAYPAFPPLEAGKGLADQDSVSIPEPLILSQPTAGRSDSQSSGAFLKVAEPPQPAPGKFIRPFSAPLENDAEDSLSSQNPKEAAGSKPEELTAWIHTMKPSGGEDLNKIDKLRSRAPQGAVQTGKIRREDTEGKTFFPTDSPAAEAHGLEEMIGEMKLNRGNPPFTARNKEQEGAPFIEKMFGKSFHHSASSFNPGDQALAGQEDKPLDSHGEIHFPSGQMEWIPREGTSFHSGSMGSAKLEMGEPKVLVGAIEGSAANLNGAGNRVEGGREALPSSAARPEVLNVPAQVVQRILWSIRNQEERIKLTLDPPELGHLYIEINRSRENIHATLWADNAAAKTALETGQHQIQRIMENEGFKLTKFDVFVHQDLGWFQGEGKRENPFAPDGRTPIHPFGEKGKILETSPVDPVEIRRPARERSSLDLWV